MRAAGERRAGFERDRAIRDADAGGGGEENFGAGVQREPGAHLPCFEGGIVENRRVVPDAEAVHLDTAVRGEQTECGGIERERKERDQEQAAQAQVYRIEA